MKKDIEEFVNSCTTCQKIKSSRKKVFGKLKPLPIPSGPWKSLGMDFIVKLPISNGFDSILVIVDRFSKMCHLIPCNETIDAKETAILFLKNVVKHHGLPMDIVSDRGPQFVSKFWSEMCRRMNIERKLSTSAHPQTDGQTERTNQTLEQFLRAYVNHKQDDWSELLHFAEMAMNNAVNKSSKRSPFEINCGFAPNFDFLANNSSNSVPNVDVFMEKLRAIWIETIKNLKNASTKMKNDTDHLRRKAEFKIGDFVYLDTQHLKRTRPSKKLDFKRIGPFKIIEKINDNAFRLKFPSGSRLHDVINVSKLTPFKNSSLNEIEPDPDQVDGFEEFEVDEILDQRIINGETRFLIRWKGYSELHNSWEPEENLSHCKDLLNTFKSKRLDVPIAK